MVRQLILDTKMEMVNKIATELKLIGCETGEEEQKKDPKQICGMLEVKL